MNEKDTKTDKKRFTYKPKELKELDVTRSSEEEESRIRFLPDNRDVLVKYIQARGADYIVPAALTAIDKVAGPFNPRGTPSAEEIYKFLDKTYGPTSDAIKASIDRLYDATERRDYTAEEVQKIKDLISHVGKLEFLILANNKDDAEGVKAAREHLESAAVQET